MKDHGYTGPGVRLYELDVYEKVPLTESTKCQTNKTIYEDKRIILHEAVCVHGILESKFVLIWIYLEKSKQNITHKKPSGVTLSNCG